jgi:predicted flap endonuclease-1-like 5' DNA nuclease
MSNTALIVIGVVVVLAIAAFLLLARKPATGPSPAPEQTPAEGHGLADSAAAAVLDVTGPVIGADLHPDLPADDLTRIKGLGPKAQGQLNDMDIRRFAQLAELDPARAAEVDKRMGNFQGRLGRDQWIEQARLLEQNDIAGFEERYGKLG